MLPAPGQAPSAASQPSPALRDVTVQGHPPHPMVVNVLPGPCSLCEEQTGLQGCEGALGLIMDSWELPLPGRAFPSPSFPTSCAALIPSPGCSAPRWVPPPCPEQPQARPSPQGRLSPLEQPRGRAPLAGARCRSALSRGRAPPRSLCSESSASLTELTSRAMLLWLSDSSCGQGTRGGTQKLR